MMSDGSEEEVSMLVDDFDLGYLGVMRTTMANPIPASPRN